jgi:hypothetical protein
VLCRGHHALAQCFTPRAQGCEAPLEVAHALGHRLRAPAGALEVRCRTGSARPQSELGLGSDPEDGDQDGRE